MTSPTDRAAAPASARAEVEVLHDRIDAGLARLGAVLAGSPLDLALRRQGEAPTPERDLIAEYDRLLADVSRHLFGMEVVVCPLVARARPEGRQAVRSYLDRTRRIERTMRAIERLLWGDAQAPTRRLDVLHHDLVQQMAEHRADETRMLEALELTMTPTQCATLAARVELATRRAPTRPHPFALRRASWTRALYRPVAVYDRLLDLLASRPVARIGPERLRRPRGLWGSYLIGRPLPPEPPAEPAATPTADPRPR